MQALCLHCFRYKFENPWQKVIRMREHSRYRRPCIAFKRLMYTIPFSSLIGRFVFANANGQKSAADFRFSHPLLCFCHHHRRLVVVDIQQLYRSAFHIVKSVSISRKKMCLFMHTNRIMFLEMRCKPNGFSANVFIANVSNCFILFFSLSNFISTSFIFLAGSYLDLSQNFTMPIACNHRILDSCMIVFECEPTSKSAFNGWKKSWKIKHKQGKNSNESIYVALDRSILNIDTKLVD